MEEGRVRYDIDPRQARDLLSAKKLIPRYPGRRTNAVPADTPVLLAVDNLSCHMDGNPILENVSFQIRRGETVALVGRNGAGKTTLVRHLNGLTRAAEGQVLLDGKPLGKKSPAEIVTDVAISFQNPNDQFFKNRVRDELSVGLDLLENGKEEWFQKLCNLFNLEALLGRPPYQLSEGEKKRVALASILAMRPRLLVLDEPTVGQDGRGREALASLLLELEDEGFTTLIVTHDLDFARATAQRWLVLENGRIRDGEVPNEIVNSIGVETIANSSPFDAGRNPAQPLTAKTVSLIENGTKVFCHFINCPARKRLPQL